VAEKPLPQFILENFESDELDKSSPSVMLVGGTISNMCGTVVSGEAAVFHQVSAGDGCVHLSVIETL